MLIKELSQLVEVGELHDDPLVKELCVNVLTNRLDALSEKKQNGNHPNNSESVALLDFTFEILIFAHAHHCDGLKIRCKEQIRSSTFIIDGRVGDRFKAHPDLLLEILNFYRSPTTKSYRSYDLPIGWSKRGSLVDPQQLASPASFNVQLKDGVEGLRALMAKIASSHADAPPLVSPRVGMPCLARYDQVGRERWYRAEIRRIDNDESLTLRYVDYGFNKTVPRDESYVRVISDDLLWLPVQCVECRVSDMTPLNGTWGSGANRDFRDLIADRDLTLDCVSQISPSCASPAFPLIHEVLIGERNDSIYTRFFERGHIRPPANHFLRLPRAFLNRL